MSATSALTTYNDPTGDNPEKASPVIVSNAQKITKAYKIVSFNNRAMVEVTSNIPGLPDPFAHFVPLHKDMFERLAYPLLGGVTRSRMNDVFQFVINTAPDLTHHDHLIAFGTTEIWVWNARTLEFERDMPVDEVVWRSPYLPARLTSQEHSEFVLQLAGGSLPHYSDFMQSMAPLIMERKPDGVIWWIGSGANGKSSLMEALYRIFPDQLASLNVKALTDERDTPMLNGHLGNVVKESSEGRIEDTQIYKSIGTHEDFRVHKFHSQDSILIRGNIHHIFSGNSIPSFNDKGYSATRRTHVIPFTQRFESDPDFNRRTFTPENLSLIVSEMMRFAIKLREQQYLYKFSDVTLSAKEDYDMEANSAVEYARELLDQGVVGFDSFDPVKRDYEQWCVEIGYTPLGMKNLRQAVQNAGFERTTFRTATGISGKKYRLRTVPEQNIVPYGMSKPGFYSAPGFRPEEPPKSDKPAQTSMEAMLNDW